jgi:membrane-bound metal-dependent hydrolase YbcI (DUF457 family)
MAYATTHIIFSMLGVELFIKRFKDFKKFLPKYYYLIAAIGGLIPDLDIVAYYILYFFGYSFEEVHRTFMHSIFIPIGLLLAGLIVYFTHGKKGKYLKVSGVFFIFTIGCIIHLILDMIYGRVMIFYPFSYFGIGLNLLYLAPEQLRWLVAPIIDGIVLLVWVFWMNVVKKKEDFF